VREREGGRWWSSVCGSACKSECECEVRPDGPQRASEPATITAEVVEVASAVLSAYSPPFLAPGEVESGKRDRQEAGFLNVQNLTTFVCVAWAPPMGVGARCPAHGCVAKILN
jgi:hypothetical protein